MRKSYCRNRKGSPSSPKSRHQNKGITSIENDKKRKDAVTSSSLQPNADVVQHVCENDARETVVHIFRYSSTLKPNMRTVITIRNWVYVITVVLSAITVITYLVVDRGGIWKPCSFLVPLNFMIFLLLEQAKVVKSLLFVSWLLSLASMHWGVAFKFENSQNKVKYWTVYGDRARRNKGGKSEFNVRAHRGPPRNVTEWHYLGFICASPKAIVDEAKQQTKITQHNKSNYVRYHCQEWAVTFFNHLKTKYELNWSGPKSLDTNYNGSSDDKLKSEVHRKQCASTSNNNNNNIEALRNELDVLKTSVAVELAQGDGSVKRQGDPTTSLRQVLTLVEKGFQIENFSVTRPGCVSWARFGAADNNFSEGVLIQLEETDSLPACYCTIVCSYDATIKPAVACFTFAYCRNTRKPEKVLNTTTSVTTEWSLEGIIRWHVMLQQWQFDKQRVLNKQMMRTPTMMISSMQKDAFNMNSNKLVSVTA